MGIVHSNATFLRDARARGVDFTRTLTLGRQRLYVHADGFRYGEPADDFLKQSLGIRDLQTLDHSAYEGAALTHDLNLPLPAALHEQFDAVIDSGTLEHVFNLPIAMASCMQLVKRGGTIFLSAPANNYCGHGFYQFSPELFFRLFKDANGFTLTRMVLVTHPFPGAELSPRQTWYDVTDPADIGRRAPLMTRTPAFLMIEAKRVAIVPVLAAPPQQSDYVAKWKDSDGARGVADGARGLSRAEAHVAQGFSRARAIYRALPPRVQAFAIGWYQRLVLCTLRNRHAFRRLRF